MLRSPPVWGFWGQIIHSPHTHISDQVLGVLRLTLFLLLPPQPPPRSRPGPGEESQAALECCPVAGS